VGSVTPTVDNVFDVSGIVVGVLFGGLFEGTNSTSDGFYLFAFSGNAGGMIGVLCAVVFSVEDIIERAVRVVE
jgi:hypothetical protein